jgi:hypothetical protein
LTAFRQKRPSIGTAPRGRDDKLPANTLDDVERTVQVSNFDQIAAAKQCIKHQVPGTSEGAMSNVDQFWLYAKEAMLLASDAETEQEKQTLFDLARTWAQAALLERASSGDHDRQLASAA